MRKKQKNCECREYIVLFLFLAKNFFSYITYRSDRPDRMRYTVAKGNIFQYILCPLFLQMRTTSHPVRPVKSVYNFEKKILRYISDFIKLIALMQLMQAFCSFFQLLIEVLSYFFLHFERNFATY